jgi:hypothetical protein
MGVLACPSPPLPFHRFDPADPVPCTQPQSTSGHTRAPAKSFAVCCDAPRGTAIDPAMWLIKQETYLGERADRSKLPSFIRGVYQGLVFIIHGGPEAVAHPPGLCPSRP